MVHSTRWRVKGTEERWQQGGGAWSHDTVLRERSALQTKSSCFREDWSRAEEPQRLYIYTASYNPKNSALEIWIGYSSTGSTTPPQNSLPSNTRRAIQKFLRLSRPIPKCVFVLRKVAGCFSIILFQKELGLNVDTNISQIYECTLKLWPAMAVHLCELKYPRLQVDATGNGRHIDCSSNIKQNLSIMEIHNICLFSSWI